MPLFADQVIRHITCGVSKLKICLYFVSADRRSRQHTRQENEHEGETGLWVIDFDAGVVMPADATAPARSDSTDGDLASTVKQIRASRRSSVRGLNLAIIADNRSAAASHQTSTW